MTEDGQAVRRARPEPSLGAKIALFGGFAVLVVLIPYLPRKAAHDHGPSVAAPTTITLVAGKQALVIPQVHLFEYEPLPALGGRSPGADLSAIDLSGLVAGYEVAFFGHDEAAAVDAYGGCEPKLDRFGAPAATRSMDLAGGPARCVIVHDNTSTKYVVQRCAGDVTIRLVAYQRYTGGDARFRARVEAFARAIALRPAP